MIYFLYRTYSIGYSCYTFRQVSCPTAQLLKLHLLLLSGTGKGSFTVSKGPYLPAGQLIACLYRTYFTHQAIWSTALTGPTGLLLQGKRVSYLYRTSSSCQVIWSTNSTGHTSSARLADLPPQPDLLLPLDQLLYQASTGFTYSSCH